MFYQPVKRGCSGHTFLYLTSYNSVPYSRDINMPFIVILNSLVRGHFHKCSIMDVENIFNPSLEKRKEKCLFALFCQDIIHHNLGLHLTDKALIFSTIMLCISFFFPVKD